MEPDDISILEISGEDDSLLHLQEIPTGNVSSLSKTYFTCSPLQLPRSSHSFRSHPLSLVSPIGGMTNNENEEKLNSSPHRDSVNKENTSVNKPEVPKLCMEPQQMKRKKKGGGYNLRKSLAWDRAFFTDEGVLNPLELSLISGNTGKSSGETLSVIHEDRRESLVGEPDDLAAIEENLFKELPASTVKDDRKSGNTSLAKKSASAGANHDVASASAAKRKVLSTQDVNRSGSKRSGCPRPVASTPANVNTTRAATKELNVSKIPVRKPDPSVNPTTVKKTIPGVSSSKQNQTAQPAVRVQRNSGLKCSSSSFKNARSNARSGSKPGRMVVVKSSTQQAERNVVGSVLKVQSSTNSLHSLVTKAHDTSKINPVLAFLSPGNSSNNHDGDSKKLAISFPPKVPSSGGSSQHAQLQTAKPSGLRMPSPSLGFFNQSKASSSHSLFQRGNQACSIPESTVSDLRKYGTLNAIHERTIPAPAKIPNMVNGLTACANMRIPVSVTESSFPSILNPDSLEKKKSNLHVNGIQKVELIVPSNSKSFDIVNNEQSLLSCNDIDQQPLKNVEQRTNEKISHAAICELQNSDNKSLLRSAKSDQLMKDDSNERVSNVYPTSIVLSGSKLENLHIPSQLHEAMQLQGVFETKDKVGNLCEGNQMCNASIKDHNGFSRSQSGDADGAFSVSPSGDANLHNSSKGTSTGHHDLLSCVHDVNEETRKQAEEALPCTLQVDQIYSRSQKSWINNSTFPSENRSSEFQKCICTNVADSSSEARCCSAGKFETSYGLSNSKNTEEGKELVTGVDNFCTESQLQSVDGIVSVGRGKIDLCSLALDNRMADDVNGNVLDANGCELKSCSALCSKQPALLDSGFDMAITVEHPHRDDTLSSLTDTEFRCNVNLHGQTVSGVSETMDKHQKADVATAHNIEVPNFYPNSECELENFHCMMSQPSTLVQVMGCPEVKDTIAPMQAKGGSLINEINEHEDVEKICNFSKKKQLCDSLLQPGGYIIYSQQNTSTVHNNQLNYPHIVSNLLIEGNQRPEACDGLLIEDHMPFEESLEFTNSEVADVRLDAKCCGRRELESPHALSQHDHEKQTNEEVAGVGDSIKKSILEEEQMQVLDRSLSVDSRNCNFISSKLKNKYSVIVDDVYEQSGVHSELYNSDRVAAHVSLDTHGLCLKDELIVNNCSEELQERNVCGSMVDVVLDQSNAFRSALNSVVCTQVAPAIKNDGFDEDQKEEYPSGEDKASGSVETESSVEDLMCYSDMKLKHDDDGLSSHTCSLELDVSEKMNEGQISGTANSCNAMAFCSLSKEAVFSVETNQTLSGVENIEIHMSKDDVLPEEASISQNNGNSISEMQHDSEADAYATEDAKMSMTGSVFQDVDVDEMKSDVLPEEVETIVSQKNGSPDKEIQHELDGDICALEDRNAANSLKKSGNDTKHENLVIKPPPNAVPFSDEWLAAFEAAGEEILTMKRGAVQNSPPDKSQPEPGPWSPVKRNKNQGVGPYDCTKFTNIHPSTSN